MATANINPILRSISGRVGNVVFYRRKNKLCVRLHVIPVNPDTQAQRSIRIRFSLAVKLWQKMTERDKYKYIKKARSLNMSGYNLFISEYMKGGTGVILKSEIMQINKKPFSIPAQRLFPSVSYSHTKAFGGILSSVLLQDTG